MLGLARIVTYIAAVLGAFGFFGGMAGATGAPQEAVAAAASAALVIIPYAISTTLHRARIVELLERADQNRSGSKAD